ncbi:uncharacterized protein LAJ45_01574 [Morchella importuna]|uniref:uncharacterized protein n=1 Tax=Morchella importuna TaxID=1174673 RepID=UPI001E8DFCF0|nr:uncharacterized protein LAJ45_01574 [Morchella importuna]KAH8153807.1 hypothetical protein LAJ45_01574 [Morchella importuna]
MNTEQKNIRNRESSSGRLKKTKWEATARDIERAESCDKGRLIVSSSKLSILEMIMSIVHMNVIPSCENNLPLILGVSKAVLKPKVVAEPYSRRS